MKSSKSSGKMPELLNRKDLAEYLGVCLSNVDRLGIPRIKLTARRYCYKKTDVDLWLENQKEVKNYAEL